MENERWQARLEDPQSRKVLAEHFRMALTETNDVEDDSASRDDREDPAQEAILRSLHSLDEGFQFSAPRDASSNINNQKMRYR